MKYLATLTVIIFALTSQAQAEKAFCHTEDWLASAYKVSYLMYDDVKSTITLGSNNEWRQPVKANVKTVSVGKKIIWDQTLFSVKRKRDFSFQFSMRLLNNGSADLFAKGKKCGCEWKIKLTCKTQ